MELQLEQKQIPCLIPIANRSAEDRFSSDFVVPDALPDAAELLLTEGDLCLWRLDLSEESAELEGEIAIRICCADENGTLMSFPVRVPVLMHIRSDAIAAGQRPFLHCSIVNMTSHLINSRKVRVQGMIRCALVTYDTSEITVTTGIHPEERKIFQRKEHTLLPYISAVEEQVLTAEETLPLGRGIPSDGCLISYASALTADSCDCQDQRVAVKGRICTSLLYQDAETQELISEDVDTPFSCILDINGDVSKCRLSLHLTSGEVRCRNDDPAVDTEFHVLVQVVCYAEQEVEYAADAYSNEADLKLNWTELSFPKLLQETEQTAIEEAVSGELGDKTICAVRTGIQGEKIIVTMLLQDTNHRFSSIIETLKPGCVPERLGQTTVRHGDHGQVLHVPITVQKNQEEMISFRNLSCAEEGEQVNRYSSGVTLVRREETADLWKLAKDNCSSVEAIEKANPEQEQTRKWLVVPHVV